MSVPMHRAPTRCPVCSDALVTLRLGCPACGTEISGGFTGCPYCHLASEDLQILEVFLRSRGNMREVQSHLGVSYPTARQRFAELLQRIGLAEPEPPSQPVDTQVLADLAAGRISVDQAAELLEVTS